ncbi:hypothetical protein G9P44_000734 [Scheffersomyces stipitis]|nr:hypothetical protein G9P44_000734 [Scheffersomyces stipitis]
MSIESLIASYQRRYDELDENIASIARGVNFASLSNNPRLVQQFHGPSNTESENEEQEADLSKLSIAQLNRKYDDVDNYIVELQKIELLSRKLDEINVLLSKKKSVSDLLDFQQLFTLFRSAKETTTAAASANVNIVIYKHIAKSVETAFALFVEQLEEYLRFLLPDEYTIENISILNEFNALLDKNATKLESYSKLRSQWDSLVDKLLSPKHTKFKLTLVDDKFADYDSISLVLTEDETSVTGFIKSVRNLLEFINFLQLDTLKHYLNSKISLLLINKISVNIDGIVNNKESIDDLKILVDYSTSTNWNVLAGLHSTDTKSIEEKLNKLHLDWIIDNFINDIRKAFNSELIEKTKEWTHSIDTSIQSKESQNKKFKDTQKESQTDPQNEKVEDDDDAWNEDWDDAWDEDEPKTEIATETKPQAGTAAESNAEQDSNKSIIVITELPTEVESIVEKYRQHSSDVSYLISSVKALSLSKYPPLSRSFLLLNDMTYLASRLDSPELVRFAESNWNQYLVTFYQGLKSILGSLNLSDSDSNDAQEDDTYGELDDYNLNQLSLIYSWFDTLVSETDLQQTNNERFKQLIIQLVEFVNAWLIHKILSFFEITEGQSTKIANIIDSLNNVTVPYVMQIGESQANIKSYNKLNNYKFLLNNHLKDIMDRFYQGELFDMETDELIKVIKSVFIHSELRDNYINEIIEFRNMT